MKKKVLVVLLIAIFSLSIVKAQIDTKESDNINLSIDLDKDGVIDNIIIDKENNEMVVNDEKIEFDEKIIDYYIEDITNDLKEEIIVTTLKEGTGSLLSYKIYNKDNDLRLIYEKKDLYKGKVYIKENNIIEEIPVYEIDNSNISPSNIKIKEYTWDEDTFILIKEELKQLAYIKQEQGPYENPSEEEIKALLEEAALKRGMPPAILQAIAYTESGMKQFTDDGNLLKAPGGEDSWGIMQINLYWHEDTYDRELIQTDIKYNIEAGADILFNLWLKSFDGTRPKVGNGENEILENWYFAIWQYNGWSTINNPNLSNGNKVYQEKVLLNASKFGQEITPVDKDQLPLEGLPKLDISTPLPSHTYEFNMFNKGDVLIDSTNEIGLSIRDGETWELIDKSKPHMALEVIHSKPISYDGYLRYNIRTISKDNNVVEGWIALNWAQKMKNTDVNNDNTTDIYDLVKLARNINKENYDEHDFSIYDLNNDLIIDNYDLLLMTKMYNKK